MSDQKRYRIALLALFLCLADLAFAGAWPVDREWNSAEEDSYSEWIVGLGKKQWSSADSMLHDQGANSLLDTNDSHLRFRADCGDLPYLLRAYYAYKRRLPMILNQVDGGNYSPTPNRTISQTDNLSFEGDVKGFFSTLPDLVNTANLRIDPNDPNSAVYPIQIDREHLRPGTVFYDPNGHAAVVSGIKADGSISLIDAHPDQSVTRITFGEKLNWRSASHLGGFLAFRPIVLDRGSVAYKHQKSELPGFSLEQHAFGADYHLQVQMRLATEKIDPVRDLENYIRNDTYQELKDRVAAVERGWQLGKATAIPVPRNIYYCTGAWEDFATPGRDIRLRISFLAIPKRVSGYLKLAKSQPERLVERARDPQSLFEELAATQRKMFANLMIHYTNSQGIRVPLTLTEIEERLFDLSFDPNHPPELRWGATGKELGSAPRDRPRYHANYELQQYWRNRLEHRSGTMFPSDDGNPRSPPEHDISAMIDRLGPAGLPRAIPVRSPDRN
jgi:hypothetical protein